MARVSIELPALFHFTTSIPIRITDLNYGGHVGNDALLGILHEARLQYLKQWGYTELNLEGIGLIMSDVAIAFKGESFYGDVWTVAMKATAFSRVGFELYYRVTSERGLIAEAKTGMICFDYSSRKPVSVPAAFKEKVNALG
jgi:acyl-CoA thioester hydrolase